MTAITLFTGLAATLSCVMYVQVGGVSVIDSFITPPHAKKEVVYKVHKDIYNKMEAIIKYSPTLEVAENRVKAATWPKKVIHVALMEAPPDKDPSFSEGVVGGLNEGYSSSDWTNLRAVIRNGTGYGTVITEKGQRDVVAIDNISKCLGKKKIHYTAYIEAEKRQ